VLQLNNISIKRSGKIIIKNASIEISKGSFIAITGPNGTGKSTLLNVIAGWHKIETGNILLNGIDISKNSAKQRSKNISFLHQDPNIGTIGSLTVEENLALATQKGAPSSLQNGLASLQQHPILNTFTQLFTNHKALLKQKVSTLSGGQRQLLATVIATATRPDILLMDEPTAALSPAAAKILIDFINDYSKQHEVAVLMITHATDLTSHDFSNIWLIQDGQIIH